MYMLNFKVVYPSLEVLFLELAIGDLKFKLDYI